MKMFLRNIITFTLTLILTLLLIPMILFFKIPDTVYSNNDVLKDSPLLYTSAAQYNKYEVKFLGIIPVKNIEVKKTDDLSVQLGGIPIGVRVSSDGVIVVGYSDVEAEGKKITSPGKTGGLEIGDIIIKINGNEVFNAKDLHHIIEESNNGILNMEIIRKNQRITKQIQCVKEENSYKIGLWVRDSTAGVGTMTFYHNKSHKFGALGHPVTDCDTNEPFVIKQGNILESSIISVKKGKRGCPGELRGVFVNEEEPCGTINKNTKSGIYGYYDKELSKTLNKNVKVAARNEIVPGPAKIIATIDENGPKEYSIEIEKLNDQREPDSKSMVIRITDQELLDKTGGIVQGMSGSPIVQKGKLVGAVTHVLINKPDTGYGIYIEWMLEDAGIIR